MGLTCSSGSGAGLCGGTGLIGCCGRPGEGEGTGLDRESMESIVSSISAGEALDEGVTLSAGRPGILFIIPFNLSSLSLASSSRSANARDYSMGAVTADE